MASEPWVVCDVVLKEENSDTEHTNDEMAETESIGNAFTGKFDKTSGDKHLKERRKVTKKRKIKTEEEVEEEVPTQTKCLRIMEELVALQKDVNEKTESNDLRIIHLLERQTELQAGQYRLQMEALEVQKGYLSIMGDLVRKAK